MYGYDLRIFREDGTECGPKTRKGIAAVLPSMSPGCLSTVWGQDERFVSTYFSLFKEPLVYSSYDWAIKDENGYFTILGRTDDVINVAAFSRLGTREIEEAVQNHKAIAEVAVVGVEDKLKGQVPIAFAVVKDAGVVDYRRQGQGTGEGESWVPWTVPGRHCSPGPCLLRNRTA